MQRLRLALNARLFSTAPKKSADALNATSKQPELLNSGRVPKHPKTFAGLPVNAGTPLQQKAQNSGHIPIRVFSSAFSLLLHLIPNVVFSF